MRTRVLLSGLAVLLILPGAAFAADDDGFQPLFNGKNLDGWHGDSELWSVEDGTIVGTTDQKQIKKNSFLSTEKKYGDFVLRLKFKFRNGNSGVQFRSEQRDDYVVAGYQADIADNQFLGILYEEKKRGILARPENPEAVKAAFKPDGWNEYVITAKGPHITQVLNGVTTIDYTEKNEKGAREGIIAFQLHVGPKMRIEFKDIEIKELD